MKHRGSEAKLIAPPQQANFGLAGVEAQPAASGAEFAPEYGTELRSTETSLAATVVQAPAGTLPPEVSASSRVAAAEAGTVLRRWAPILLKFTSVSVAVQAIGFAAGIFVIRNLPKQEYAFYTLCNTMLSAVLVLADGGISSALTAIGGRVWHDRIRLSQLMQTALQFRRVMAAMALPAVITVLVLLLRRNGASAAKTTVLVTIVLVGCGLELVTRIYAVALRLKSEIRQIQKQALISALVRFAVIATAVVVGFNVEVAILAAVAGFAVQYWMLQKWSHIHLDAHAAPEPEMRREILSIVRQHSPHTIYYCLQAQMMVWLISLFGNTERVADVGALSRLAVVFSLLSSVMCELLFPAFARVQNPAMVRRRYLQIVLAFAAVSGSLICLVAFFPGQVLSVLGGRYSHLHTEGVLMAISSVIVAIAGMAWGLNTTRAWIVPPWRYLPLAITLQIMLIHFLDLSTVRGVLELTILNAIPDACWAIGFALLRMRQLQSAKLPSTPVSA